MYTLFIVCNGNLLAMVIVHAFGLQCIRDTHRCVNQSNDPHPLTHSMVHAATSVTSSSYSLQDKDFPTPTPLPLNTQHGTHCNISHIIIIQPTAQRLFPYPLTHSMVHLATSVTPSSNTTTQRLSHSHTPTP